MRIPEPTPEVPGRPLHPQPQEPQPQDPQVPGPKRASKLDRILDADRTRRSRGDLVVRLDLPGPGAQTIANLGLGDHLGELVARAERERVTAAGQVAAEDAVELAAHPARALRALGVITARDKAATPVAQKLGGVRFVLPEATEVAAAEPPAMTAVALLQRAYALATASDASWRATVADPDPVVRAAAAALDWSQHGIPAGSAAAAAIAGQVIDAMRAALGLPVSGSGHGAATGPLTPTWPEVAPPVDVNRGVVPGRTVRVPIQGA